MCFTGDAMPVGSRLYLPVNAPPFRRLVARLLGASAWLAIASGASAQTLTWGVGSAGGSGTWSTSVANWSNGSSTVPWTNGDAAVFAGTAGNVSISGQVTASQLTFSTAGYILQNGFLLGGNGGLTVQTDADATIFSPIFGAASSATAFTKSGAGTLLVNGAGAPAFFGTINVAAGELRYGNTTNPGGSTAYVLSNTGSAALTFSNAIASVGSLSGGGASDGVVRPTATSGSVTFNLNGVGNASYSGTFQGNGTTFTLQKNGSGTQTLTGFSYYAGSTVVSGGTLALGGANGTITGTAGIVLNQGGTFQLDNSAVVNQTRLDSSVPVTLNGGTFSFVGNTASQDVHQTVGALYVQTGASAVSVTSAGTGVSQLIFSNKTSRSTGATVDFSGGGHVTLTGASNLNGILGGYATVGADWASVDANGNVVAFTGYTTNPATAGAQDNLRLRAAGGNFLPPTSSSLNSLNLVNTSSASAAGLQLGAGQTLTLASGGLLTSGNALSHLDSGAITAASGELIVTNQAALSISSAVTDSGGTSVALTKSGAGTLALTGTNSYTGATYINQGTVQASSDANLGKGGAVVLNGGTLQTTGSFNSTKSLQGASGTVDTAGNNVTFDNSSGSKASFTKTGAGILTLTRENGAVTVNGGTLRLTTLVGGNSTAVTLTNGRLEAGDNGLQSVTTLGSNSVALSPGQTGQADTFTVGYLMVLGPTVVEMDLGGTSRNDLLSISYNLTLGGASGSQLLFRFNNLGNLQTGTSYMLAVLPSSQLGQFSASSFGFDPTSTAAGYQGTISLNSGRVNVVFSSVPEPGTVAWFCLGTVAAVAAWQRRGERMSPCYATRLTDVPRAKL